jgi:general secretion pathway protein H
MSRTGDAGFTLLELLVALAIMALLAALATPLVGRGFAGPAIETAARELAADLLRLRQEARDTLSESMLVLDLAEGTYRIASDRRVRRLPPDMAVSAAAPSARPSQDRKFTISFFADGSATGGTITLATAGRQRRVVIERLSGRVSLQ